MTYGGDTYGGAPFGGEGSAAPAGASFFITPNAGYTPGSVHITAVGVGTSWTGSNPFSIASGPGSGLTNYVNTDATHASFDFTLTSASGVPVVFADSSSGTSVNFDSTPPPTTATLTGPSTGTSGASSSNFTITLNHPAQSTITFMPAGTLGLNTFTPAAPQILAGQSSVTFTDNAVQNGTHVVSITNNGGLSNVGTVNYASSGAPLYNQWNVTDTVTGENIMVLVPAGGATNPYMGSATNVVLYAHGNGEDQTALVADSGKLTTITALLNAGYILAGTNAHGNNWGTQQSVDDYAALDKYVRDNYNVANVAVWGQSMGGLAGLSACAQGKVNAVGFLGTYPVCNLAHLYGLGVYTAGINTAHGITNVGIATYANKTWGLDPALMRGFSFGHIPMRFYASAGDTSVPKANNTDVLAALVAGSCREATVVVCTGNHGDASHFQPSDYAAFFARCFATPVAKGRPATTKTATITLTSDGTTPRANLTGLKWSWWDQATPDVGEYPTDKGVAETTDGSGVLVIPVRSNLAAGGIGWLVVTDSDGTTGQNPAAKAFSGPIAVT